MLVAGCRDRTGNGVLRVVDAVLGGVTGLPVAGEVALGPSCLGVPVVVQDVAAVTASSATDIDRATRKLWRLGGARR